MTTRMTNLRDGFDLNTLQQPGQYAIVSPTNGPDTGSWFVFVAFANVDGISRLLQTAYSVTTGTGFARVWDSGWTAWSSLGGGVDGESAGGDMVAFGLADLGGIALLETVTGRGRIGVQDSFGQIGWSSYSPQWAGTALISDGLGRWTSAGSSAVHQPDPTSSLMCDHYLGVDLYTSAATNQNAHFHQQAIINHRGGGNNFGGFHISYLFGFENSYTPTIDTRVFFGLNASNFNSAIAGGTDPSALLNVFGVGKDDGDTGWSLYHNDGSGVATKTAIAEADIGASPFAAGAMYQLVLAAAPGDAGLNLRLKRLDVAGSYTARVTTDIPASTQGLSCDGGINNDTAGVAQGFRFFGAFTSRPIVAVSDLT